MNSAAGWLPILQQRAAAEMRLFCIGHAGAGTAPFYPWLASTPDVLDVRPVRLPARETRIREEPIPEFGRLLDELEKAVAPLAATLPYAIFGQCSGALVAYELAQRLALGPIHLFVSGQVSPAHVDPPVELLSLDLAGLVDRLTQMGGFPPIVAQNAEILRLIEPALRADLAVAATYSYSGSDQPLKAPISAFTGASDSLGLPELLDWRTHTQDAFTLHMLPDGHFFSPENWLQIAGFIARELLGP